MIFTLAALGLPGTSGFVGEFIVLVGIFQTNVLVSVLASLGFSGSLVFYNAFLPEIVSRDKFDRVSARGYSFGYVGSVILLIICLVLITFYDFFGFSNSALATRFTFLLVGIWWIVFSQITFITVP